MADVGCCRELPMPSQRLRTVTPVPDRRGSATRCGCSCRLYGRSSGRCAPPRRTSSPSGWTARATRGGPTGHILRMQCAPRPLPPADKEPPVVDPGVNTERVTRIELRPQLGKLRAVGPVQGLTWAHGLGAWPGHCHAALGGSHRDPPLFPAPSGAPVVRSWAVDGRRGDENGYGAQYGSKLGTAGLMWSAPSMTCSRFMNAMTKSEKGPSKTSQPSSWAIVTIFQLPGWSQGRKKCSSPP